MSGPSVPRDWWVRPRVMLPVLLVTLVLVVFLSPDATPEGRLGDDRLSAHLAGSMGARALADVASRLGWQVVLHDSTPTPNAPPGVTIHAVLAPPVQPTAAQAHRYLEAVREGDALLLVLSGRSQLGDSLGVRAVAPGGLLDAAVSDTVGCRRHPAGLTPPLWLDGRVHLYELRWVRGEPAASEVLAAGRASSDRDARAKPVAVGFPFGAGRIVVVSDPDLLRNDVLRRCAWGADVVALRMLEWLRAGGPTPRTALAFDEFHQGFGPRPGTSSVTARFLTTHPVGRTLLQLAAAGLVLLLALGPRAIVPRARPRAERRDPLEQADALAHAYQQVHATRTASRRLVHGLRGRVEPWTAPGRHRSDEDFLDALADGSPAREADVALVQRALRRPGPDDTLAAVGAALRRLEAALSTLPHPHA